MNQQNLKKFEDVLGPQIEKLKTDMIKKNYNSHDAVDNATANTLLYIRSQTITDSLKNILSDEDNAAMYKKEKNSSFISAKESFQKSESAIPKLTEDEYSKKMEEWKLYNEMMNNKTTDFINTYVKKEKEDRELFDNEVKNREISYGSSYDRSGFLNDNNIFSSDDGNGL